MEKTVIDKIGEIMEGADGGMESVLVVWYSQGLGRCGMVGDMNKIASVLADQILNSGEGKTVENVMAHTLTLATALVERRKPGFLKIIKGLVERIKVSYLNVGDEAQA